MNDSRTHRLLFGDDRDPRQELAEIFDAPIPDSGDVQPAALDWARGVLGDRARSEVEAIKALRDAEPRLGLKTATYLASRV